MSSVRASASEQAASRPARRGFVDVGLDGVGADGVGVAQVDQGRHFFVQGRQAGMGQAGQHDQQGNDDAETDGHSLADAQIIDVHPKSRPEEKECPC